MTDIEIKKTFFTSVPRIAPESDPTAMRADREFHAALDIDSFDFLHLLIAPRDRHGVEIPADSCGRIGPHGGRVS